MSSAAPHLSVCIIACNEERELPRCLDSVSFADECIVVVDARSSDGTEKLARERGAIVRVHPYEGNVEQKNRALTLASGEWLLALDADEAVTQGLASEILDLLAAPPTGVAGFELDRITHHLGRWIRHGDFHPDWQLRLFRRASGRWLGENPHGRVAVEGAVRRLAGELEHHSYRDLSDQIERIQDWSAIEAQRNHAAGRRHPMRDMVLRPPARFLRAYLLKQGFRDGVPGLIIAVATAFHVFLKYAKQWELERSGGKTRAPEAGKAGRPRG
ncbi:MAG: glycosyltransferase family 2 protein [Myxococcota bacterium]